MKIYSSMHTELITRATSSSPEVFDDLPPSEVLKRVQDLKEKIANSDEKIDLIPDYLKSWCAYKKKGLVGEGADRFLLERMKIEDNAPSESNNGNEDGKQIVISVLDTIIEMMRRKINFVDLVEIFHCRRSLFKEKYEPYLAVEYICSVLGCAKSTLNIRDSGYGSGYVSDLFSFKNSKDGTEHHLCSTSEEIIRREATDLKNHGALFVLLVQNKNVLNHLIEDKFCNAYPCIIIAGHEFPTATVISLSKRVSEELKLPCFLDWDPWNWKILMGCGGAGPNKLPSYTKWLGIRPSDISELHLPDYKMKAFAYLMTIDEYLSKQEPKVKRAKVETIALYAHGMDFWSEVFIPFRLKQIIQKEIEKFNHMSSKFLIMREQATDIFKRMNFSSQ